jgi:hypothetical protein
VMPNGTVNFGVGETSGLAHSEDSLNGYPGSSSWNESWHRRHGHPARSQSP